MMRIDLSAPACLYLGIAPVDGEWCELGVALTHPPLMLTATKADEFVVSGARAEYTHEQAMRNFAAQALRPRGNVEIEFGLHSQMGIGSDAVHTFAVCSALQQLYGLTAPARAVFARSVGLPLQCFEWSAYEQGGIVAVGNNNVLQRRIEIPVSDDDDGAWVWVLVLPRLDDTIPENYEMRERASRWNGRKTLSYSKFEDVANLLFKAIELRDFDLVCSAVKSYSLLQSGLHGVREDARDMVEFMQANGAGVSCLSSSGLGIYALIKGTRASQELRDAITRNYGYEGPAVFGALTNNVGALLTVHDEPSN